MAEVKYTDLDKEIIILAAIWELIDSMVHYGYFVKCSDSKATQMTQFTSTEARDLFLVMLSDFLAHPRDGTFDLKKPKAVGGMQDTHLAYLRQVVEKPQLGKEYKPLEDAITSFSTWLGGTAVIDDVYLPSIRWNGTFRVKRKDYLKVCGNATKHGFTRLTGTVKIVKRILSENNLVIDDGQGYIVISDFIEWFRDDIFIASANRIAWHLNEIRWSIYEYLTMEFRRSFEPTEVVNGLQSYKYNYPNGLSGPLIESIYWDLMNAMRSRPFVPRFTPDPYLYDRY